MTRHIINPLELVRPCGFNRGTLTPPGRFLFLAGQTGNDARGTKLAPGDRVAQYEQTLRNLQTVVETADGSMADIAQSTLLVRNRNDNQSHPKASEAVYCAFSGNDYTATVCFEAARLFLKEALAEITGIAVLS